MAETSHSKGLLAELKARSYLRSKGFRILTKRFKTPLGEIDFIAQDGKILIFVEVKLRKTKEAAAEAIDKKNKNACATRRNFTFSSIRSTMTSRCGLMP